MLSDSLVSHVRLVEVILIVTAGIWNTGHCCTGAWPLELMTPSWSAPHRSLSSHTLSCSMHVSRLHHGDAFSRAFSSCCQCVVVKMVVLKEPEHLGPALRSLSHFLFFGRTDCFWLRRKLLCSEETRCSILLTHVRRASGVNIMFSMQPYRLRPLQMRFKRNEPFIGYGLCNQLLNSQIPFFFIWRNKNILDLNFNNQKGCQNNWINQYNN